MLVTEITAQSIDEALRKQLAALEVSVDSREVGTVIQVGDGIARVDGLRNAMAGELLEFMGEGGKTVYDANGCKIGVLSPGSGASYEDLNDWSAIRITDPATKAKLAEFGHQPYIATAPLLYVFVIDEHRNARIAERKGIDPASDEFHLKYSYRFTQAQNDAVLALHAMETAAYSLGLGCVILGSLLNNIPGLIDVLNLPEYTYPVLGLAIGKPDQNPTVKPRMPRTMQFFENTYPADADGVLDQLPAFDEEVHRYYDLRQADRPVDAFSDQVATISRQDVSHQTLLDKAAAQGFRLDQ